MRLLKDDKQTLQAFQEKHIETASLEHVFSRINENHHFDNKEKEYLKKILVDNINNAFKRMHP